MKTYVADMTVEEFRDLIRSTIEEMTQAPHFVRGYDGLCELFGCSRSTAKRIKASGAINKAISQQGRTFVVNSALALQLYGNKRKTNS